VNNLSVRPVANTACGIGAGDGSNQTSWGNQTSPARVDILTPDNLQLSQPKTTDPDHQNRAMIGPSETVRGYVQGALADNTKRAYQSDLDHFIAWGGAIPTTDVVVAEYLAQHVQTHSIATLARRAVAISRAHAARGLSTPTNSALVQSTLKGIKRAHGMAQRRAKPLLVEDLIHIVMGLDTTPKDLRDKALLLIGFAGGFRRSELVALDFGDIEHVREGIVVTIKRSKTDQIGKGRRIGIPIARGHHCPVRSLEAWIECAVITDGPLYRPVSRHGHTSNTRLSGNAVSTIVKQRTVAAGLDADGYSGHSLRAGLATSAARAGISTLDIRRQTGHTSDASLARYVRDGEIFINNPVSALL